MRKNATRNCFYSELCQNTNLSITDMVSVISMMVSVQERVFFKWSKSMTYESSSSKTNRDCAGTKS
jgi:hypothetical protein